VPQVGDSLTMSNATMNLSGNELAGDQLVVTGAGTDTINTQGTTLLDLSDLGSRDDINISGTLLLHVNQSFGRLTTSGGTIQFIQDSSFHAFTTEFNSKLTGKATIDVLGGNASGEVMKVDSSVGRGLTFNFNSGGPPDADLQIVHPAEFHGVLDISQPGNFGYVEFMGLHVTSADLRNDVLRMFDNDQLVDTVRVSGDTSTFQLREIGNFQGGVFLTQGPLPAPFSPNQTQIPMHII
jgi:hypothetical protein